jgi:hypothetical protein
MNRKVTDSGVPWSYNFLAYGFFFHEVNSDATGGMGMATTREHSGYHNPKRLVRVLWYALTVSPLMARAQQCPAEW